MKKAYDLAYWDAAKMKDVMAHARGLNCGRPQSVHTSTMDYVDLRKLARDIMDVSTKAGDLNVGFMGTICGLSLYAKKSATQGVVSLYGKDDVPISHVVNPRRWGNAGPLPDHSLSFHPGSFTSCEDPLCLAFSVMGS